MRFNLKNRPKCEECQYGGGYGCDAKDHDDPNICPKEHWFEGFEGKTISTVIHRFQTYKDTIPVDIAIAIINKEILGKNHES